MIFVLLWRLYFRRRDIKKTRNRIGTCRTCHKYVKCEPWCWGPKLRMYIWAVIKNHSFRKTIFLWKNFKSEAKWAGVETWHRY